MGPSPLLHLPPMGSGFHQESILPPGARGLHGSELPALLLDFFLASSSAYQGPEARGPGFPLYFHAFRRPGFLYAFRGPDFQLSGDHAAMLSGGFQEALLPCFQEASRWQASRLPTFLHAFRLSGGQGPGPGLRIHKINVAGCFQQRPIIYIMLSSLIFPNISLTTENITPCFSTLSRTIFLFWSEVFV